MKKIYSFLMALCIVFSASANVFEYPIHLEQSNQIAATRVAKKVNVESLKKSVTTMPVKESFKTAQVKIDATSKTAAKAAAATTGLQYDATSGDVNRTYSTKEVSIKTGSGYFTITGAAADGSDEVDVVLFANKDANTLIPAGTYTFATTQAAGTALASTGLDSDGYLTYSFYGKLNANGQFVPPLYWLVGGTVEVSAADGKLTIAINAVNSNNVPVNIVCEYDLNTKQGLPYDATSGSVDRTYSDEDQVVWNTTYAAEGEVALKITAADKSDMVSLVFFVDGLDDVTTIPAGTYPVAKTGEAGTVYASPGVQNGSVYPSFYGKLAASGGITTPLYFLEGGNVVVENVDGHVKVTVAAVNSCDVPINIVYEAAGTTGGGEDEEKGLPNDATEGEVERNYGKNDQFFVSNFAKDWGMVYLDLAPADGSEWLGLGFVYNEFEGETLQAGTYEINNSGEQGSIAASQGFVDGYITESYFAAADAEGNLAAPFYFLVSGTVVIEDVDGGQKVTVDAVNSNGVPVKITYDPTAGEDPEKTPLQYDAPSGAVDRTYSAKEVIINKGTGLFQIQATAADKSDKLALVLFGLEDKETIIPVGTYEINATQAAGTALASSGVNGNSVTLSFYGKTNAQGSITVPCYFLVDGTVEVSAADGVLTIEVNAVNSYDVPVHAVIEYDLNAKQGLQYDAPSGAVDRTYTDEEITFNEGNGYFQIVASSTTASDRVAMVLFGSKDEETIIPVGTYEINGTQKAGTVLASTGVNGNSVTLSFYGKTNAQGQIIVPCYFLVGGTVEVSAADGVLTIEVNAVNSYDVPVHIVMTYDLDTKQGLKYDEQTGSVDRTYTSKDYIKVDTELVMLSNLFVDVVAEDYSDQLSLQFFVSEADEEIGIPVGTYPITSDNKMNTVLAGQGVSESGSVAPSFYSTLVEQEGKLYLDKLYFLVSGQVVVEKINGKLKMTIDAVNSYDVPVHIVYDGTDAVDTGVENVGVENGTNKVIEDNQLFIMKDGVKYNVLGSVVE